MLEALGYTVTAFSDPQAALKHFREKPEAYDLLLTDGVMPRLSGTELARQVASVRAELPIVIMTGGYLNLEDAPEETRASVAEVLHKPFTPQELGHCVARALNGSS